MFCLEFGINLYLAETRNKKLVTFINKITNTLNQEY